MSIEESVRAVRAPEGGGVRRVGIAMNGVTGRMGMNQHLIRSILAIREQGGLVYLPHPFDRLHAIPDPATLHRHLAEIDVLAGLAELARSRNYVRPEVVRSRTSCRAGPSVPKK